MDDDVLELVFDCEFDVMVCGELVELVVFCWIVE